LLPFAENMYEEPLCNINTIITEGEKLGLNVELKSSMADHLPDFEKADKILFSRLSIIDKAYIRLFTYVVMRLAK
jgi:hypothetical protein